MIGTKRPFSTYRTMSQGGDLASLTSSSSHIFEKVSRAEFFNSNLRKHLNKSYSSASFEEDMVLVGEGTYGKVYKA